MKRIEHEPGCPAICDDESDEVLADYQECTCGRTKTVEPIRWETYRPLEFLCVFCHKSEAEFIVTVDNYRLPLCPVCAALPAGELLPGAEQIPGKGGMC